MGARSGGGKGGGANNRAKDYFGSIRAAVCQGPVDHLYAVIVDGAEVWPKAAFWGTGQNIALNDLRKFDGRTWKCVLAHNPSSSANAPPNATYWTEYSLARSGDSANVTINGFGILDIFWGTTTQTASNPAVWASGKAYVVKQQVSEGDYFYTCKAKHTSAAATRPGIGASYTTVWGQRRIKHPAYKSVCWIRLRDFLFGRERVSAPNVEVVVGRKPSQSVITGNPTNLTDGQANPATATAEVLTSGNCVGLAAATLDATSWQSVADYIHGKMGLAGCSMLLDSQETLRSFLQRVAEQADMWTYFNPATEKIEAGIWKHGETPAVYTTITADDLAEPVTLNAQGWTDVKTQAQVEFPDRQRAFKKSSEKADDMRAYRVIGEHRPVTLQRPWITRRNQAINHARETLRTQGRPQIDGTIKVRREKGRNIKPGTWILLDIDLEPGGTQVQQFFKVLERTIPYDQEPIALVIDAEENLAPFITEEPEVPEEETEPAGVTAIENVRIIEAPVALSGYLQDHVIALAERPSETISGMEVYFDSVSNGTYNLIGTPRGFACRATLREDYSSAATGVLKINAPDQADLEILSDTTSVLNANNDDLLAIVVKTASGYVAEDGDEYAEIEVMSVSAVALVSGNDYDLTVLRARRDTKKRSFVTASTEVWIIHRELLTAMTHGLLATIRSNRINDGSPTTGFFKLLPFGQDDSLTLSEATAIEFRLPKSSPAGPMLTLTSPVASGSDYQWPPNWSSSATYVIGDWVWHSSTAYKCILGHSNQTPPNGTYWTTSGSPYPRDVNFAGTWTDPNGDLVSTQIMVKKDGGVEVEDESDTMAPSSSHTFSEDVNIAESGIWRVRLIGVDAGGNITRRTVKIDGKGSNTQVAKPKFKSWHGKKLKGTEWNFFGKIKLRCATPGAAIWFQNRIIEDRDWATGQTLTVGEHRWHNGAAYIAFVAHTSAATDEPGVGATWTTKWKTTGGGSAWSSVTAYAVGDKVNITEDVSPFDSYSFMCIVAHTNVEPLEDTNWWTKWAFADTDGTVSASHPQTYDENNEGFADRPYGWLPKDSDHRQLLIAWGVKASYANSEFARLTIKFKRIGNGDFAPPELVG